MDENAIYSVDENAIHGMGYEQYGPEGNWRSADISHGAPVPKS